MVYTADVSGSRRPTSGRGGAYSARGVGSSSFASPGRDAGLSPYAGVRATSGRAGPSVKPKEFKFSFEDPGASQPPTKSRPLSAGPARVQVRQHESDGAFVRFRTSLITHLSLHTHHPLIFAKKNYNTKKTNPGGEDHDEKELFVDRR